MPGTLDADTWGSCPTCGAAVPPGAAACSMCGGDHPLAAGEVEGAAPQVRRRIRLTRMVRAVLVIGVIVALAAALLPSALSGPPSVQDPLTTAAAYKLAPGASTVIEGDITGGDYVLGNYSTIDPYGSTVTLAVYNSTDMAAWLNHSAATPVWSLPAQPSGRIVFTATYSDAYGFVFTNAYPLSAGVTVTVYVTTEYMSNVGNDGFG